MSGLKQTRTIILVGIFAVALLRYNPYFAQNEWNFVRRAVAIPGAQQQAVSNLRLTVEEIKIRKSNQNEDAEKLAREPHAIRKKVSSYFSQIQNLSRSSEAWHEIRNNTEMHLELLLAWKKIESLNLQNQALRLAVTAVDKTSQTQTQSKGQLQQKVYSIGNKQFGSRLLT